MESSENGPSRSDRMARYKEDRRKQLAAQFNMHNETSSAKKLSKDSSSSEGPRPTRASKLRAAVKSQDNISSQSKPQQHQRLSSDITTPTVSGSESQNMGHRQMERDKSSKRKSNLNRSLNSEEVPFSPGDLSDDRKQRRRGRRFFPSEVLEQSNKNDANTTATLTNSPITAAKSTAKKSELSIHMENARRGITPAFSEMGSRYKSQLKRPIVLSSPKESSTSPRLRTPENEPTRLYNKENIKTKDDMNNKNSDNDEKKQNRDIAKRMEELTARTRDTLAKVEKLANKTKESPRKVPARNSPAKQMFSKLPSSILKKINRTDESKLNEQSTQTPVPSPAPIPNTITGPISILKRKVSQDDHNKSDGMNNTPPVTFSPSVIEPAITNRKQGILKKRRSLDESQVMRHRSCSPDVANKSDSRSILKNQRRSSLEELTRIDSPELQLQSILKRKTSRNEEDDLSLNSPQSILKRRSGASSAGSTTSTPHVSITTAVILAAAGGAEIILNPESDNVKPILKKKSLSDEQSYSDSYSDPKPILKKKSSTDTDDCDEKPKRPILKFPTRNSSDRDSFDLGKLNSGSDVEEMRPILKQRLSFSGNDNSNSEEVLLRKNRRSHTICSEFSFTSTSSEVKEEDRAMVKARPLSVHELVRSFEHQTTSTGAIPKRVSQKRNSDRYRTQPVTSMELEAISLNSLSSPSVDDIQSRTSKSNHHLFESNHSLSSLSQSFGHESNLNSFLLSFDNAPSPDSGVCGKMSSDSAFQSLGDGLELEQEDDKSSQIPKKGKLEHSKLESQMKAIAEEAKNMRLSKGNLGVEKYRNRKAKDERQTSSRFSTQPVTFEEVQVAARLKNDDDKRTSSSSILKPKSDASGSNNKQKKSGVQPKSALRSRSSLNGSPTRRPILKGDTSNDNVYDEGISCNDSGSDSELSGVPSCKSGVSDKIEKLSGKLFKSGGDSTSDGESSGGREVCSIFKNENKLRIKQTLESVLSKSKSQSAFGNETKTLGLHPPKTNLRRSQTHSQADMPQSIADLRAKLKESGESEWKKRIPQNNNASDELKLLKEKNRYNDELSEKTLLASKKDELDASAKQWKNRVEKSDAEKFSVAGRMEKTPTINISSSDVKKTPQPKRFKGKEDSESSSTPVSPEKNTIFDLSRSKSVPDPSHLSASSSPTNQSGKRVSIQRPDDYTFNNFYKSIQQTNTEKIELNLEDFDNIERQSLLVTRKNVKVQKRRGASRNPIKALASRTDISNEYTEVITGVAEREKKRLNIEKLAKNSNLAIEAIAGLVSNEDFKSVALKKSSGPTILLPFSDLMLLQIKGRRHVQTRLVEPVAASINEGDTFILITPTVLYNYIGTYSNFIEQSRSSDIANHIQKSGDLGCKVSKVITLTAKTGVKKHLEHFWQLLGVDEIPEVVDGGHPDEDETFESNILSTNMVYTVEDDELIPIDDYWGVIPKIQLLDEYDVIVFDFGSEMYVWSSKNAPLEKKKVTLKLAKQMWMEGYNYSECNICPLNIASILGDRKQKDLPLKASQRPEWALFAKITQHRETVLFREKFLDWPDFSRIIRVKSEDESKEANPSYDIQACDVNAMLEEKEQPDLVIEGTHLGRGDKYFDEETRRLFEYDTLEIKAWRILENTYEELKNKSIGQFYEGDSYIYSWRYRMTVKGRELNGNPSKHAQVGRERTVFFCWQGSESSVSEKCTAAFLTVELDKQNAPQVRIVQGSEPAAFLRLFSGKMVIQKGKRNDKETADKTRLFIVRGEVEDEIYLMQVACTMESLRSRSSFVLLDLDSDHITIWHGSKSSGQKRSVIKMAVKKIVENKPEELMLGKDGLDVVEVDEGSESEDFFDILGNNRSLYKSLISSGDETYEHTVRMFHFSSITGSFIVNEILCPHRSKHSSPYPFVQSELYSASQPALFLIDNHHELWLWQGWWPEKDDDTELSDQTGSGAVRWQAERRAAMQTAANYWKQNHKNADSVPAYLVWAGLEPLDFKNLFPTWTENEDVLALNLQDGKKMDDVRDLETELALLSRTTYPLEEILHRPLPDGVDPTHLENYLSPEDFEKLLSMTKEEFQSLAPWKKTALKKEKGLF